MATLRNSSKSILYKGDFPAFGGRMTHTFLNVITLLHNSYWLSNEELEWESMGKTLLLKRKAMLKR